MGMGLVFLQLLCNFVFNKKKKQIPNLNDNSVIFQAFWSCLTHLKLNTINFKTNIQIDYALICQVSAVFQSLRWQEGDVVEPTLSLPEGQ